MKLRYKLLSLSLDIQYKILERLDLHDLITFSETNEYFSILAHDVFRRKYSKRLIGFLNPKRNITEAPYLEFDTAFYINDLDIALNLLKRFGHLISSIYFSATEELPSSINEVSSCINLYYAAKIGRLSSSVSGMHDIY